MTKPSQLRVARRAGQPAPTNLTITDERRTLLRSVGMGDAQIDETVKNAGLKGTTQAAFDDEIDSVEEARRLNAEQAAKDKAERDAAERKTNRAAFAGMAMQGLLAGVTPAPATHVAKSAVAYADALLDALDDSADTL